MEKDEEKANDSSDYHGSLRSCDSVQNFQAYGVCGIEKRTGYTESG